MIELEDLAAPIIGRELGMDLVKDLERTNPGSWTGSDEKTHSLLLLQPSMEGLIHARALATRLRVVSNHN